MYRLIGYLVCTKDTGIIASANEEHTVGDLQPRAYKSSGTSI